MTAAAAGSGDDRRSLLVLGIGNILLTDEGVGVHVARALEQAASGPVAPAPLPGGAAVIDGGTLGLDLLPILEDAAAVVLVDAVDLGLAPGTVAVLSGEGLVTALDRHVSPHQVGVGDLLAAARLSGRLPRDVALVGIQPAHIGIGLDLTPDVAAAIPVAVEACRSTLRAFAEHSA